MDSKSIRRLLALAVAFLILIIIAAEAQVTFSRDWNPGKRSSVPDCTLTIKSAATICQILMNELKAIASCELHAKTSPPRLNEDAQNPQDIFGHHHNG